MIPRIYLKISWPSILFPSSTNGFSHLPLLVVGFDSHCPPAIRSSQLFFKYICTALFQGDFRSKALLKHSTYAKHVSGFEISWPTFSTLQSRILLKLYYKILTPWFGAFHCYVWDHCCQWMLGAVCSKFWIVWTQLQLCFMSRPFTGAQHRSSVVSPQSLSHSYSLVDNMIKRSQYHWWDLSRLTENCLVDHTNCPAAKRINMK